MKHWIVLLVGLCSGVATASADAMILIEYRLSPLVLAQVRDAVTEDQSRGEWMNYVTYHRLLDGTIPTSITTSCPPNLPDAQGNGCNLYFGPKTHPGLGEISIKIRKPVSLSVISNKVSEVNAKLKAIDPNQVSEHEHQNFGNPFYSFDFAPEGDVQYHCQSEGAEGKKQWACYLNVIENL